MYHFTIIFLLLVRYNGHNCISLRCMSNTMVGLGFPGDSEGKASAQNAGNKFDPWVRKIPWRMKWQPTPVLLPGNPVDGEACLTTVHGVAKSWTRLSNFTFTYALQNDYITSLVNICHLIESQRFSCKRTSKIYSLSNFQTYSTV